MKKQMFVFVILMVTKLSSTSFKFDKQNLTEELEQLKQHGITHRFIDNNTIELEQDWSGFKRTKTLAEPNEADIKAFIQKYDIPLLEIDPALIDTNLYTGWYNYWTMVPLSNAFGYPLVAGDVDGNGKAEVYGIYKNYFWDFESHVYEVETTGIVTLMFNYRPRNGPSTQITDVDNNGLLEIVFMYGDSTRIFEQTTQNTLPINRKFAHAKYEYPGTAIGTKETVINMDNDSLVDFVYRGSEWDTTHTFAVMKTYIAEYDHIINNFKKVWSTKLTVGESSFGGYDVGDYDGDGKMEFLASGMWGNIWVLENNSDNSYDLIFKDSLPFVNLFYQTSGDVDNDGKREFFVGATMSNGNWTVMYEADSNNFYSPKFAFHLLSGGTLDEPTYLTNDVDGDGKLELVILSGADLYFFKSNSDNNYYLWYYKLNDAKESIQIYDFNNDGKKDFIISKSASDSQGRLKHYADIYKASGLSGIKSDPNQIPQGIKLYQNYPNPFNPSTSIKYEISKRGLVTVVVYDILGRETKTLVDEIKNPGTYTVSWNANNLSSGIYYYQLKTTSGVLTKKCLLVK